MFKSNKMLQTKFKKLLSLEDQSTDLAEAKIESLKPIVTIIKTIITHKEGEVKLIKAITSKEKTKMEKLTRVTGIEEEGNILIEEDIIIEKDTKEDKSTKNKINKQTNSIR